MIEVGYLPLLAAALLVWVPWRAVVWRRGGGDRAREAVVTVMFSWAVAMVALTLFPIQIVLYDWEFHANLVPLVETVRLVQRATLDNALTNVGGNLLMFVPFGVLMPLLFVKSRRAGQLAAQAFAVTAAVEAVQWLSRARIFDIDDLILNTAGALVGLGLYHAGVRILGRGGRSRAWRERVEVEGGRPPLRRAALPVALVTALTLPFAVVPVVSQTMTAGTGGGSVTADAVASSSGGRVVAHAEWERRIYVLTATGAGEAERVALHDYLRVLPGRYSHGSDAELPAGAGDSWAWTMAPTKTDAPGPARVMVYGTNHGSKAVRLEVVTGEVTRPLRWSGGEYFLATFTYDDRADGADDGVINGFELRFFDAAGRDVTGSFAAR